MIEALGTLLILSFVTMGTMTLFRVGDKTQRDARFYADAQTNAREAIRTMLRTLRHGYAVQTADATWGGSQTSNASSQIIVTAPHSGSGTDHIRFYLTGTTLYSQNGTATATATATGVQSITFDYYKYDYSAGRSQLSSGSYGTATEVGITLVLKSGTVTTTEAAYVELRNATMGL